MSEDRKCYTYIWKLKNFTFICGKKEVISPSFAQNVMSGCIWNLLLNYDSTRYKDCVACYLHRDVNDRGPNPYKVDYELSFLGNDGSILLSAKYLGKVYEKNGIDYSAALHEERNELLKQDSLFIPDGTLTIRCKMWSSEKQNSKQETCVAETRMEIERRTFIGVIKKFSNIQAGCKNLIYFECSTEEIFISSINLVVSACDNITIEIKFANCEYFEKSKCIILIRDVLGNSWKLGQGEFPNTSSLSIPLNILKKHLIDNKEYYLPDDVLAIECEIIYPTGNRIEKIYRQKIGFDNQNTQEIISDKETVTKVNLLSEISPSVNFRKLKEDWISLLREGTLCDTKLKTATGIFSAHAVVLSARSPVFKSMFTTNMKEKKKNCVVIDDLDADTVRQMVLFIYSATLEDLQYKSAKSLYFAAVKYNIDSLRETCSHFLKQNLLLSNCCEILILAEKHQDKNLKIAVQDYIAKNDESVLLSKQWKNLEKKHSQLTIEVLRAVYMKNRKN